MRTVEVINFRLSNESRNFLASELISSSLRISFKASKLKGSEEGLESLLVARFCCCAAYCDNETSVVDDSVEASDSSSPPQLTPNKSILFRDAEESAINIGNVATVVNKLKVRMHRLKQRDFIGN